MQLQAVGSPELQGKVRAAREAMGRQDYKAALELCKQAERLDRTCLAPPGLLVKAQAHLSLRNYRMCIGLYGLIASQCGGLPHQDRQAPAQHCLLMRLSALRETDSACNA